MSMQWADDFSRYGTGVSSRTAMLAGLPYAAIGNTNNGQVVADPDANESGRAFKVGANGNNWQRDFRIALPTVVTGTIGVLSRVWLDILPGTESQRPAVMGIQRSNGDYLLYALVELNGSIRVIGRQANALVQVADSVNPIIAPSSWNHWEMVHDKVAGEGSLYINGVQRLTWTGIDTEDNIELVNFSFRNSATLGPNMFLKDLVIWDGLGTQNNDVMGTVIVRRLEPSGDNTLGGWTPSTGTTGFNLLAKDAPNDATYMSADDTPPAPMAFEMQDLPPDVTSVRGLISVARMRKIDGGDATVQNALSPNGVDWDNGADRPITSAFSYYFDVSEVDPAAIGPWSPAAVDDALLRIDRTT